MISLQHLPNQDPKSEPEVERPPTSKQTSLVFALPNSAPPSKAIQDLIALARSPVPKTPPSLLAFNNLEPKEARTERLGQITEVILIVFGATDMAVIIVEMMSFLVTSNVSAPFLWGACLASLATWITYRLKKPLSRQEKKLSILKKRALRLAPQNPLQENLVRNQLIRISDHNQCPAYLQKTLSSLYFSVENSKFPQKYWEKVSNLLDQISKELKDQDVRNKFRPLHLASA